MGQEEYQELSSFLKRFIRRFKFLQGIEGLCLTAICALLLFALGPGVQQIKNFFPYAPLAYSVLSATVLLILLGWTVLRFLRRLSQERAAVYIELIGINPPQASWGSLAQDGYQEYLSHPYMIVIPSIAIAWLILSAFFIADGLRDALDPRTNTAA